MAYYRCGGGVPSAVKALPTYKTASGSVAKFNTDLTENLISCVAKIMATQSGSGTPSPSNPRPMSGYSVLNGGINGKNYLPSVENDTKSNNGIEITSLNGVFTISGTATGGSANITFNLDKPYKIKNGDYLHFMNDTANGSAVLTIQRQNGTAIVAPSITPINRILDISSYAGEEIYSFRFYIANGTNFDCIMSPMVMKDNTPTAFEPYNGTTFTVNFGQTVYGGEIDVTTGVITLTHIGAYLTGSCIEAGWYNADIDRNSIGFYIYPKPYVNKTGYPFPIEAGGVFDYCQTGNVYNNDNAWTANFLFVGGEPNRFEIRLPKSVLSDISSDTNAINSAKDYLNNNPLQTVYKITPTTIQANALQIPTINGTNNLFADTGDISEAKYILSVGEALRQAV